MVGDGPELDTMKTKTSQLGLEQRVTFLGKRNDIAAILPAMDIFVLPSLHEGMPNAVLEAMAARLCVVASSVGGIPELVIHGQTGLLVPPRDSEALANALISLLNAPQMRSQMGQTGCKRALEHYSIQSNIDKTQKLYEHLLESKRSVL
jgi:glycosyltransferase involved in cell wall biosynthesis